MRVSLLAITVTNNLRCERDAVRVRKDFEGVRPRHGDERDARRLGDAQC
jgi:hypothetical protein